MIISATSKPSTGPHKLPSANQYPPYSRREIQENIDRQGVLRTSPIMCDQGPELDLPTVRCDDITHHAVVSFSAAMVAPFTPNKAGSRDFLSHQMHAACPAVAPPRSVSLPAHRSGNPLYVSVLFRHGRRTKKPVLGKPTGPMTLGNSVVSARARSTFSARPADDAIPRSTSIAGRARNQCPRSDRACGAPSAVTPCAPWSARNDTSMTTDRPPRLVTYAYTVSGSFQSMPLLT
jgi:hypothetical protein